MRTSYNGIRSTRVFNKDKLRGFNLKIIDKGKVLEEYNLLRFKNDSVKINFLAFGKAREQLEKLLLSEHEEPMIIDEVGRFEKNEEKFLKTINKIYESNKFSIIILKKEDLIFNNSLIKNSLSRKDMLYIDMDLYNEEKEFYLYHKLKLNEDKKIIIVSDIEEKILQEREKLNFIYINAFEKNAINRAINIYKNNIEISYIKFVSRNINKVKKASDNGLVSKLY